MKIKYFGTNLTDAGHYIWSIHPEAQSVGWDRKLDFNEQPFHPESLTQGLQLGEVNWMQSISPKGKFTICAIYGSCKDRRPGSKSVFWVDAAITYDALKELILKTPASAAIISAMPFEVKW